MTSSLCLSYLWNNRYVFDMSLLLMSEEKFETVSFLFKRRRESLAKARPTWCLPTALQIHFLFCFAPSVLDEGRCCPRKEEKKLS